MINLLLLRGFPESLQPMIIISVRVANHTVRGMLCRSIGRELVRLGGRSASIPLPQVCALSSSSPLAAKSIVRHPLSLDGSPLDEDAVTSSKDMFAVVALSGTQYKVCPDDTIVVDKMDGVDIGDQIDIKDVLLVGSKKATMVGHPFVVGSKVLASVEEMAKDKKVITFKTRRRKASKRMRGFRRQITVLRIDDIVLTEDDQKIM